MNNYTGKLRYIERLEETLRGDLLECVKHLQQEVRYGAEVVWEDVPVLSEHEVTEFNPTDHRQTK